MYGDVIHIMWVRMIEEASLLAEPNHIIPLLCDRPGTYSSDTIIIIIPIIHTYRGLHLIDHNTPYNSVTNSTNYKCGMDSLNLSANL